MKIKPILFALFAFLLAACSTSSASLTGEWTLVSYGDSANPTPALPGAETGVTFENGRFGGSVGCNSLGADYTTNGDQIKFDAIVATRMYCIETSDQENAVLAILSEPGLTYQLNGNQLVITSPGGQSVTFLQK